MRQRRAIAKVFFVAGLLSASWVPHVPYVRQEHDLGEGTLGLVLLALGVGAVAAMIASGSISALVGPQVLTRWGTFALAVAVTLPVVAPNIVLLVVALAIFGGSLGLMDVAMNAVAADIEIRFGRTIMSSVHGLFSAGALAGSLVAAGLLSLGISPAVHTCGVGAITALVIWPSLRILPAPAVLQPREHRRFRFPRGRLLVIGVLAFVLFVGEGAAADWSATLLRVDLLASGGVAALGFAAFSCTMAVGRLIGDRVNRRCGPVRLLRVGTAIAAIGFGTGLIIGEQWSVIVGFAILGAGFANAVPLLFTAAAAARSSHAEGIASVASLGYLGLLLGPPVIGAIAEFTSLTVGLAVVVVLTAIVSAQAQVLVPRPA